MEEWENDEDSRVSTAIVLPGSNIANHLRLFSQIRQRLDGFENRTYMVSLSSKECPNIKAALRLIVTRLTESKEAANEDMEVEDEDEDNNSSDIRYDKRLRYDLDILSQWCNKQVRNEVVASLSDLRIIVLVQDADSFQVSLLTQLIEMMQSYITTIPLKLMLSVATSLEVFQEKLSRKCIRLLKGRAFQAEMAEGIVKILTETLFTYDDSTLLLSPDLFNSLVHRQKQSLESIDTFITSLKYIFMAHYYSNPFSVLTSCDGASVRQFITGNHIKALRMLPSFKAFVETKVSRKGYSEAKKLLQDDEYVISLIYMSLEEFKEYIRNILSSINIIIELQKALGYEKRGEFKNIMDLYATSLTGALIDRPNSGYRNSFIDALLGKVRKLNDGELLSIIEKLESISHNDKEGVALEIYENFQKKCEAATTHSLAKDLADTFEEYFKIALISYKQFFMHEALLSDLASLQENVFLPTYRGAIELGLSNPKHYWGDVTESTEQPPVISVLYQLYRESSVFINIYDYYTVFRGIVKRPEGLNDEEWNRESLAWFLQGIAELKFLGIMRDSKRKFECVEKISWKDL